MFRTKRGIRIPYNLQGYIYFYCKRYRRLPPEDRERIRRLCREVGGEYGKALLSYVTTDAPAAQIARKHYTTEKQLERLLKAFYERMGEEL